MIAVPCLFQDLGHYTINNRKPYYFRLCEIFFQFSPLYSTPEVRAKRQNTTTKRMRFFLSLRSDRQSLAFASVHPGHCIITCAMAKQTRVKRIVFTLKNNVITEGLRRSRTEYSISHCYDRPCVMKPSKGNRRPPE